MDNRQTARREDDRWFRELIDSLGDMVCRYRVDTTILYASRAYISYFGAGENDGPPPLLHLACVSARPSTLLLDLTPSTT